MLSTVNRQSGVLVIVHLVSGVGLLRKLSSEFSIGWTTC
jgi:hypothetical protein